MIYLEHINKSFLIDQTKQDVQQEFLNGAVIGGFLDLQRLDEIAESYLKTTRIIIEEIKKDREFAYEYAYPTIFLIRHAIEIKLKSIYPNSKKNHSFHTLRDNLIKYIEDFTSVKIQNNIKSRVNEFIEIDERSTRFRYGSDPKDEYVVDLEHMFNVVTELFLIIDSSSKMNMKKS